MPENELRIEGLEELQAALRRFPDDVSRDMRAAMTGAIEMVRDKTAVYPAASAANSPPGVNGYSWYERGFGTRTVTGKAYATSEALGRSWTTKVEGSGAGAIRGIVGTNVSYAKYVQGSKTQVGFHKARGWKTLEDVMTGLKGDLEQYFGAVIKKILARVRR